MKPILFNFESMGAARDKALSDMTKLFTRNGLQVVSSEVSKAPIKRAGISLRNVDFTFADGQTVTLGVKETGDIFEVRINKAVQPLRDQEDPAKAVAEIAGLLDKKRMAFQRAMARVKVVIPPSVRVNRRTLLSAKVEKRDGLREAVSLAKQALAELVGAGTAI